MKKILVIGSNSFSGSDFIDLLLEKKEYKVVGISRSPEKSVLFLPYLLRKSPYFTFQQIDLNRNFDQLKKVIDEFQPEYIVNFAAQSEVAPSWENPHQWFQTNAVAITQLADLLKNLSYLKRYVHISSPEVYGTCVGNIKEDAPLNPSTPYAASKAAGDLSLFTFVKNFSFPLVMIRATNVYGAHQQLFKIIPRSAIYLKLGKTIELHGGGVAVKSYIHIRDVSQGELFAMEHGRVGEIYHFSPNHGTAVRDVVATICKKMGKDFTKVTREVPERLGQDKAYTIDSTKARKEFGWTPRISFDAGIEQTVFWVEKYFDEIQNTPLNYVHKE
ncbi:MAG: NAD(P)-bd dom protein [Parachlamydiales bacterium]|nr:NAD(P)-bd dom protein [Parachlamydiales bacterium]